MRTISFILILLSLVLTVQASELLPALTEAFEEKNYVKVVGVYDQNLKSEDYRKVKEVMIITAKSLEKEKRFQDAAKIYMRIVRFDFLNEHKEITKALKEDESLDSSDYDKRLLIGYWNAYKNYGSQILKQSERSTKLEASVRYFNFIKKILEQLEFREDKVDKLSDQILNHLKQLDDKVYHLKMGVFFEYLTWQRNVDLTINGQTYPLVITNKGHCAGGEIGYENSFYHFFTDACLLVGSGNIQSKNTVPTYQQSNLPIKGLKLALGAGKIVSSSKAEIGFKIPVMIAAQDLVDPPANDPACSGGCKVEKLATIQAMFSLYSRWHFSKWYVQTEFGKFVDQDPVIWALGAGYQF